MSRETLETNWETPHGIVAISFMKEDVVLAVSGLNTGWMKLDGTSYYAAARFKQEDGAWKRDAKHQIVCLVEGNKAGRTADPETTERAFKVLAETVEAWSQARPDMRAKVRLVQAEVAVERAEDEIARTEESLRRMRAGLKDLMSSRDEAREEYDRVLSGMDGSAGPKP